jgi:hypothetical protein
VLEAQRARSNERTTGEVLDCSLSSGLLRWVRPYLVAVVVIGRARLVFRW